MNNFLLLVSVSLDTLKNTYYNYFCKNVMKGHRDTLLFNAVSCIGSVVYFLFRGASLDISAYSIIIALIFGAVIVAAQYFALLAMGLGSMSYSVLFTYLSMLIPTLGVIILSTLSAIILFREKLPRMQLIGLIAGIISVLCLG